MNGYNVKSLKVPKGKEGSLMYLAWLKEYGEEEATRLYVEFRYQVSHGIRGSYHVSHSSINKKHITF